MYRRCLVWHFTPHVSEKIAYFGDPIMRKDGTQQLTITIHADDGRNLSAVHVYVAHTRRIDGKQTFTHYWFQIQSPGVVNGFVASQFHNTKCELEDNAALTREMTSWEWNTLSGIMTTACGEPSLIDGRLVNPSPMPKSVKHYWREAYQTTVRMSKRST